MHKPIPPTIGDIVDKPKEKANEKVPEKAKDIIIVKNDS